jgi:hypothetical protein
MRSWILAYVLAGGAVGWLDLDWRYAVGASIGLVALEDAARDRLGLPSEQGTTRENAAAILDVAAFLAGYVIVNRTQQQRIAP